MDDRAVQVGLYGASAVLVAATFAWPILMAPPDQAQARARAEAALREVAEAERATLARQGRYVPFSPAPGDMKTVLPKLDLSAAQRDFSFDALLDRSGVLHIRAVSRADAVGAGRVAPVLATVELADGPKPTPNTGQ